MPDTIITRVRAKKTEIEGDQDKAIVLRDMAVDAINGGIRSGAWKTYMLQFIDPDPTLGAQQLERLLATDNTLGDVDLNMRRAYLLGNAVCGPFSPNTANLDLHVESIDAGLPMDCIAITPLLPE